MSRVNYICRLASINGGSRGTICGSAAAVVIEDLQGLVRRRFQLVKDAR